MSKKKYGNRNGVQPSESTTKAKTNQYHVGEGSPMSRSFLGGDKIVSAVESIGCLLGKNIARVVKDKIEADFDVTPPAFRVGKPIVAYGIESFAVIGTKVIPVQDSYPLIEVTAVDTEGNEDTLTFSPQDYFGFTDNMSEKDLMEAINESNGPIWEKIFESPFAAARVAQKLNSNEKSRVMDILDRYNNMYDRLEDIINANDAPFVNND